MYERFLSLFRPKSWKEYEDNNGRFKNYCTGTFVLNVYTQLKSENKFVKYSYIFVIYVFLSFRVHIFLVRVFYTL